MVKIISIDGIPLMPTRRYGKVRRLLKDGKAKVICRNPFTIQLLYKTETEITEEIKIGIDLGYKFVGFALVTQTGVVIEKGTLELRQDVSDLLTSKRTFRRSRRNRKMRYRKARFDNRKRVDGWLAPSTQSKYNHIINWIENFSKYLPSYSLSVEIAKFDIQKINNPEIKDIGYQQGDLYGYRNIKNYIIAREQGKCQYCKKGYKDGERWQLHHIKPRSMGGVDKPSNLALLHESCHAEIHAKNKLDKLKKPKQYKDSTFMNIIKWKIVNDLKAKYDNKVSFTYGHITQTNRENLGLSKTHYNDAIAITKIVVSKDKVIPLYIKQVRKKKRSLHEATARKGRKTPNIESKRNSKNTKEVYVITKFKKDKENKKEKAISKTTKYSLYDKVLVNGKIGYITGFSAKMLYVQSILGEYLQVSKKYKQVSTKEVKHIKRNNNWIMQRVA
jgi:hypothetical protein